MNQYHNYVLPESIRSFMYKVYGWMTCGLLLTGSIAFYIAQNKSLMHYFFKNSGMVWIFAIIQIGLAISLVTLINRMNFATVLTIFLAYATLTGITLSSIFYVYHLNTIALSFGITCGMFALMGLYGYFTKADLTSAGSIAQMALWGIIIAMLINMFMQNAMVDYIISLFGVGIFTILIAYDTQKLKELGYTFSQNNEVAAKASIMGALILYLDFINLFLHLLRLFGNRRSE